MSFEVGHGLVLFSHDIENDGEDGVFMDVEFATGVVDMLIRQHGRRLAGNEDLSTLKGEIDLAEVFD